MTYQTATVLSQTAALILFVGLFVAVIAYVFWPSNKKKFDEAAQIPLDKNDDEPDGDAR
jgi:cytochrome c oxidase cbb3-type subunit 4